MPKALTGSIIVLLALNTTLYFACSSYPGSGFGLAAFLLVSTCSLWLVGWLRPSIFLLAFSLFLSLGFLFKFVAHFGFGVTFIEPVGAFNGSASAWDKALSFAISGLGGVVLATLLASRLPCLPVKPRPDPFPRSAAPALVVLLAILLVVAAMVYGLNLHWNILRIGYPIGVDLPFPLYPILSFIISWGSLLGALTLLSWLVEMESARPAYLIYVASLVGLGATLTMGSRVQLLLYVFAAVLAIALRSGLKSVRALFRQPVIVALLVSALMFAGTIAAVSLQRSYAFNSAPHATSADTSPEHRSDATPTPPAHLDRPDLPEAEQDGLSRSGAGRPSGKALPSASPPAGQSGVTDTTIIPMVPSAVPAVKPALAPAIPFDTRLAWIASEVRSLVIMRWVGLEGVMTTAGAAPRLALRLLADALAEDPAKGTDGIYQHMSGDPYATVTAYTFLTLPGPVGVASFSGKPVFIFVFMLVLTLAGHMVEWIAAKLVRNIGTTAVAGTSLAYLGVQMCFPWTLFVYALEFIGAAALLGLFRLVLARLVGEYAVGGPHSGSPQLPPRHGAKEASKVG